MTLNDILQTPLREECPENKLSIQQLIDQIIVWQEKPQYNNGKIMDYLRCLGKKYYQNKQYDEASKVYLRLADMSLQVKLLQFHVRGYVFNAFVCMYKSGNIQQCENIRNTYLIKDNNLDDSTPDRVMKKIIDMTHQMTSQMTLNTVNEDEDEDYIKYCRERLQFFNSEADKLINNDGTPECVFWQFSAEEYARKQRKQKQIQNDVGLL